MKSSPFSIIIYVFVLSMIFTACSNTPIPEAPIIDSQSELETAEPGETQTAAEISTVTETIPPVHCMITFDSDCDGIGKSI